ncbi:MAG: hypothetical protein JJU02_02015 [Cryomorphaceae bacterium]|nr:hypothetical protein [Cryomorphaceae bacterium]
MNNTLILRFLFASWFCLQVFFGFSQSKDYWLSFNLGVAQPLGAFANKQPGNGSSSFARSGSHFDMSLVKKISDNYGIILSLSRTIYLTDHKYYIDKISGRTPGAGDVFDGNWETANLLVGILRSFNLNEKFQIESALMMVLHRSFSPELRAYNLDGPPGSPRNIHQYEKDSFFTLGLAARLSLKYNFNEKICFLSTVDFLWANPRFDDRKTSFNYGREIEFTSFKQQVTALVFSLGVGFKL